VFELGTFIRIKGAAGPLLFWIITFVAISATNKACWKGWR
jgi:hypothetical protein